MIDDVFVGDIALIELKTTGATDALADILAELKRRGQLTADWKLTREGRRRARALRNSEAALRHQYGGDGTLRTVGTGGTIRLSGPVRIQS
jgi:hypothetical protein